MSSFEIAKGFTKPLIDHTAPVVVAHDLITALETLIAKKELNLIMRTKATVDPVINPGDLVQVYILHGHEKRGKWSSPRAVNSVDSDSGIFTVPGSRVHKINAAIEDTEQQ